MPFPHATRAGGGGENTQERRWIVNDPLGNAILYASASGTVVQRRVFSR